MKMQKLIESSNIPEKLIRAVVRKMGGWESFTSSAADIANHGIDGGFNGFIYTQDTWIFTKRNRKEISALASAQADDMGTSVTEMIQGFGCFRNGDKPTDEQIGRALYAGERGDVSNALAWYAGEEVARAYVDLTENETVSA